MFSIIKSTARNDNDSSIESYVEAACLSTDSKSTTGIANGSTCIEMNTGKIFMFNEAGSAWVELQ